MMWNWHVSALASGATLVVFDGSPVYPNEGILWDIAHRAGVSLFGTSAKYLAALEKNGYSPKQHFDLSTVRTLCSTGSALYPEQFDYVYQHIGQDIHLASISGGTDICGCFVLGNPISRLQGNAKGADSGSMSTSLMIMDCLVVQNVGISLLEQFPESASWFLE